MKLLQAVLLQLLCIGLVRSQSNFLQVTFSADKDEVEAGEAVTFKVIARRTPGHPSTLQNNEVTLNFISFSGFAYNQDQASTYVNCNLQETTTGTSKMMQVEITNFDVGREMDCSITMRMSSSLRPASIFRQNLFLQWKEIPADGVGGVESNRIEWNNELSVPKLKLSMALNDGLDKFYTCGPPHLGINLILDFPKSDLSSLSVELRWPLGGRDPDVEIIRIPETDIGEVKEGSGVTAGPLTASQNPGDLTAGIFRLTNVQAAGQSINSFQDIVIETRLEVVDEFRPLKHGSQITIGATLTHSASDDGIEKPISYTSEITFEIIGPEMDQRWECEQFVNGGKTAHCHIWVANRYNATNAAQNVKLFIDNVDSQVRVEESEIEYTEEYSVFAADIPTSKPSEYVGNVDTGLEIIKQLNVNRQVHIMIPIVIGTADVGPIDAVRVIVTYENDYADPCTKDFGRTQLDFVMMIPTFDMEPPGLNEYFPKNIVVGENHTVDFPMQIPQGRVEMRIELTAEAHGAEKTTYDRHTRQANSDLRFYNALEILSVEVDPDQDDPTYTFTSEELPLVAGYGFTFPRFTNTLHEAITNRDRVIFRVNFRMNDVDFLDAGDIVNITWSFVVNDYAYTRVFDMVVGEPDVGFLFKTFEDGGRIHWNVTAIQQPGASRSTAYNVTYRVEFNDNIPVVAKSYSKKDWKIEMVEGDVVDRYVWYRDIHQPDETFSFGFVTYLDDSDELAVVAEYRALSPDYKESRQYTSRYLYPVALHQTNHARNLRVGLAAAACFFIGILFAMLIMLVCCKRTTVLPIPTKFELYSRRPAVRLESWIRDRGDLLLAAELADDLVQALTEKDYKASLTALDTLDIAHTVAVEEDMSKQQRQLILESVGWIVTVSDLKAEGKKLFQQLDKDYKASDVELADQHMAREKELEGELQQSAKSAQEKLMDQQDEELDALVTVLQSVPFQERVDFIELLKKQHEVQRTDFEVLLRLQLEEEREKLRRDFIIRKRVALNVLVKDFFSSLAEEANLNNDVRDDLISRSKHYIDVIDEAFHEEACRQKFVHEERLLKREATLRIKEERVKYHNNLMASVSNSMKQTINRLIRESLIKRSYGEDLLNQINISSNENKTAMVEVMKNYEESVRDTVKSKAQDKARKQLNAHLEAYEMFQQKYNDKLGRKEVSPAEFLERKIRFHIGRRMEEEQLFDEMDELTAQELAMVWDHFTSESLTRFRENQDKIFETLIKRAIIGSSQTEVQRQRNFRDQTKLETEKNNAIKMIENALQQRVLDSEERIKCQVEAEKLEQTALKEQEAKMVERLLESQLVMNQETRDNVMREHRRNLLELEEGLTVQKLRYKRKKQERLAEKIARRLEKMMDTQTSERELFKSGEGRTDDTIQNLLNRHQEDRMDLLRSVETLDLHEAEEIHNDIMEEKSGVLTDQKRRLASMLASLQVQKSREVATLRGQLNALTKVELNLIDDLSSRGVLQDTKVKEMVDAHLKDMEGKIGELNGQKERQKNVLTGRLDQKLKGLEEELVARHQQQAEEITERADKSPAYMYKKMLLLQKQKNERKQLRDTLRIETEQTVEELERKFELIRLREIKIKELKFISQLIQHADFDREELADVFKAMFVTRSKEELDEVLQHAKVLTPQEKEARGPTTLLSRAKEELVRRQSSQRFQLTAKRQGLLKPKIRPRRAKDAAQFFPRSIRTVAQEAMLTRLSSRGSTPQTPTAM